MTHMAHTSTAVNKSVKTFNEFSAIFKERTDSKGVQSRNIYINCQAPKYLILKTVLFRTGIGYYHTILNTIRIHIPLQRFT